MIRTKKCILIEGWFFSIECNIQCVQTSRYYIGFRRRTYLGGGFFFFIYTILYTTKPVHSHVCSVRQFVNGHSRTTLYAGPKILCFDGEGKKKNVNKKTHCRYTYYTRNEKTLRRRGGEKIRRRRRQLQHRFFCDIIASIIYL